MYSIGEKLPKRNKLGVHAMVEKYCLELLALTIIAAFSRGVEKISALKEARVRTHIIAHLLRTEHDLGILTADKYLRLSAQLVEIGKMLSGWIVSQTHKEP